MKTYTCLACGAECKWGRTKINKYCNGICKGVYEWIHVHRPKVARGESYDGSPHLKRYLVETCGENCTICGVGNIYNNKPLTLQVDHIDGNSDNNHPSNLRLLCPNCHSQTDTHGSKGVGNRYRKDSKRNRYLRAYKLGE